MGAYQILKLNKEPFDFLVIATSPENPLSNIEEISREIKVEQARILFDLTLINSTKSNRYVSCDFRLGKSCLQSYSSVKEINEYIKDISHNYFWETRMLSEKVLYRIR